MNYTFTISGTSNSGNPAITWSCKDCRTSNVGINGFFYYANLKHNIKVDLHAACEEFVTLINEGKFKIFPKKSTASKFKHHLCFCDPDVIDLDRAREERLAVQRSKDILEMAQPLIEEAFRQAELREAAEAEYEYKTPEQIQAELEQEFDDLNGDEEQENQWGLALNAQTRNLFFKGARRKALIEIKKRSLTSGKVIKYLECTKTELNRWDEEGVLSPYFICDLHLQGSGTVSARYWLPEQLDDAIPNLALWREKHVARKKLRRMKKKPLKIVK